MFNDFISPELKGHLLAKATTPLDDTPLRLAGDRHVGLETPEAIALLAAVYASTKGHLGKVLDARAKDRDFIDSRTKAARDFNSDPHTAVAFDSAGYRTVLGLRDPDGRVVAGPLQDKYVKSGGAPVAPLPDYLQGPHVTLFGPPDTSKMAINAVNCLHRQLPGEPDVVRDLVEAAGYDPKWGADDEDSKTPLRADILHAGENLKGCYDGTLRHEEGDGAEGSATKKTYAIAESRRALPIKRIPGLALPCTFLFDQADGEPLPLHLYDFALHLAANWREARRLVFYIPKLESEEEAAYCREFIRAAEDFMAARHPGEFSVGTVRVIIVMENPRAIFRTHEIMDALHPYFAGASLGWHDYLAATARLFKEDPNYRIPVKADPNIVVKYIQASHRLLTEVVGPRGGIKIGGMYGVLPIATDTASAGFQVVLKGYFRDVCTQLKRGLDGFWVAHPDFVRIGVAIVQAWRQRTQFSDPQPLRKLVRALIVAEADQEAVIADAEGPDVAGLDVDHPMYARSLIVADLPNVSNVIANSDPEEVRYNIFQTLQYLADWLGGRGCVALPAIVGGQPVRVMDDLATCERSRWEVWCELYHGRFTVPQFLRIAEEEMLFIRRDQTTPEGKRVQVKFNARTEKWYPVAFNLMVRLMTDPKPVEFATELLLPFTLPEVRSADSPWDAVRRIDPVKFASRFRGGISTVASPKL